MRALLEMAQKTVYEKLGVMLEPEIEFVGEW
jgi:UDP-N-acetylenolpyruvoylglucosamine reductase